MDHEEKIRYMRIAAGIAGFNIREKDLDLLVSMYELILEKKEKGNIQDVTIIEDQVKKRSDIKARKDLLDKVSEE